MINDFCYPKKSIARLSSLEKVLGTSISILNEIKEKKSDYYFKNAPDKKGRITLRVEGPLKKIQHRILNQLLRKVQFPHFIHSGIKSKSCFTNASSHLNSQIIINEDIMQFFPNSTEIKVYNIWKYFFKFSSDVAMLLTSLTTFNNQLPQGACTSPHLSNLLFWDYEAALVKKYNILGICYSRYADDVSMSSLFKINNFTKTIVISMFYGMLIKTNFKPNRNKQKIFYSNNRMIINGLVVNGCIVRVGKNDKGVNYLNNLRASLHQLINHQNDLSTEQLKKKYLSLLGKLNYVSQNKKNASIQRMKNQLKQIDLHIRNKPIKSLNDYKNL